MGYAFTFPLVAFLSGRPNGGYVHYPTISPQMVERVQSRQAGHTNQSAVASSAVLSLAKYLWVLSTLSRWALMCSQVLRCLRGRLLSLPEEGRLPDGQFYMDHEQHQQSTGFL